MAVPSKTRKLRILLSFNGNRGFVDDISVVFTQTGAADRALDEQGKNCNKAGSATRGTYSKGKSSKSRSHSKSSKSKSRSGKSKSKSHSYSPRPTQAPRPTPAPWTWSHSWSKSSRSHSWSRNPTRQPQTPAPTCGCSLSQVYCQPLVANCTKNCVGVTKCHNENHCPSIAGQYCVINPDGSANFCRNPVPVTTTTTPQPTSTNAPTPAPTNPVSTRRKHYSCFIKLRCKRNKCEDERENAWKKFSDLLGNEGRCTGVSMKKLGNGRIGMYGEFEVEEGREQRCADHVRNRLRKRDNDFCNDFDADEESFNMFDFSKGDDTPRYRCSQSFSGSIEELRSREDELREDIAFALNCFKDRVSITGYRGGSTVVTFEVREENRNGTALAEAMKRDSRDPDSPLSKKFRPINNSFVVINSMKSGRADSEDQSDDSALSASNLPVVIGVAAAGALLLGGMIAAALVVHRRHQKTTAILNRRQSLGPNAMATVPVETKMAPATDACAAE